MNRPRSQAANTGRDPLLQQLSSGWRLRIPVHEEVVHAEKLTVVYEEVDVRREYVADVAPAENVWEAPELGVVPDVGVTERIRPAGAGGRLGRA